MKRRMRVRITTRPGTPKRCGGISTVSSHVPGGIRRSLISTIWNGFTCMWNGW